MEAEIGLKHITARAGDIVFYERDIPHSEWNDKEIPLEIIYLDWEGPDPELPMLVKDIRGRARIMSEWLIKDFKTSLYRDLDESIDSLMHSLLEETKKNADPGEDIFVHKIQTHIVENISDTLTLESLADNFEMNKYTFLRKYKNLTGKTPIEEVRRLRIEKARDLIISTDLPLKEIAIKTGMSNEHHLSRTFSRYLKVPPGYYRKNH